MMRKFRELRTEDGGIALVWLATTVVLLLGTAGFAVDLGWLYLNASRAQRTVDSAALAGVVHLPGFPNKADLDARDAARANQYDVCDPSFTGCADILVSTPLSDNELEVELSTTVDSFFMAVLGFDSFDITRKATAEYVKPVPLGSPNRCFGQDPTGTRCASSINDFWAAVSAPYTRKSDGDPYSTNCLTPNNPPSSCSSGNIDYARAGAYGGYYYAVEVGSGVSDLTVSIYDAAWDERNNYPNVETADARYSPGGGSNPGLTTSFQLHDIDSTPSDPTDNPVIAGCSFDNLPPDKFPSSSWYKNTWRDMCTISGSITPGTYVLHVWTSGNGSGTNQYSIAATVGTGPDPRVYGINDMSIFSNNLTSASQLYLVEIDPIHAGSKLELMFFDAGDASGYSEMRVKDPFGNIPDCDWQSFTHDQSSVTGSGTGPCEWVTTLSSGTRIYDNEWIVAYIDIPATYTCNGSDCFWYMELDLSQPNERTTWRARIIGNPVKLVP